MKAVLEYIQAINEIREATLSGKINWVRNRPDSFKFKTMNEDLEDLIIDFSQIGNNFLFSLVKKDFEGSEVLLNIDTSGNEAELNGILEELFETVEYHVDMKNLDSLNRFVNLIKSEKPNSILFEPVSNEGRKNGHH